MSEPLSTTLSHDELNAYLARFNQLDFIRAFGAQCSAPTPERVQVLIQPVSPLQRGGIQGGAVNGGVLAAIFDLALGLPGLLRSLPDARTATVQLSMSFMRAVRGDVLRTESWIARGTGGLLFTEAETFDEQGQLCASASGVVRMMEGYAGPPRAY